MRGIAQVVDKRSSKYIDELLFKWTGIHNPGIQQIDLHLFNKLSVTEKKFVHEFIGKRGEKPIQKNGTLSIKC